MLGDELAAEYLLYHLISKVSPIFFVFIRKCYVFLLVNFKKNRNFMISTTNTTSFKVSHPKGPNACNVKYEFPNGKCVKSYPYIIRSSVMK